MKIVQQMLSHRFTEHEETIIMMASLMLAKNKNMPGSIDDRPGSFSHQPCCEKAYHWCKDVNHRFSKHCQQKKHLYPHYIILMFSRGYIWVFFSILLLRTFLSLMPRYPQSMIRLGIVRQFKTILHQLSIWFKIFNIQYIQIKER